MKEWHMKKWQKILIAIGIAAILILGLLDGLSR